MPLKFMRKNGPPSVLLIFHKEAHQREGACLFKKILE